MSTPTPNNATPMRKFVDANNMTRMEILKQLDASGVPISPTSFNRLLNHNVWPTQMDQHKLRVALTKIFTEVGTPEKDISAMLEKQPANKKKLAVYPLGDILRKYSLTQTDAAKVVSATGVSFGATSMSQLINHGVWPKTISEEQIKTAIYTWLEPIITDNELATIFVANSKNTPVKKQQKKYSSTPNVILDLPEPAMLNAHTLNFFKLPFQPFDNEIRCEDDLFMSQNQMNVREAMVQACELGSMIAVIGESGAGKSEIRKGFFEYLKRAQKDILVIEPKVINKKRLTSESIFDAIAEELGIEKIPNSLERKARAVERALRASLKAGNSHVLLIEEAHDLTTDVLKYLKRIWELSEGFDHLMSIILIAQPELANKLAAHKTEVREFANRCSIMNVPPLGNYLGEYIAHKFKRCHVDYTKVIDDSAIDAIAARLQGKVDYGMASGKQIQDMTYPLMVNNLLSNALNECARLGEQLITDEIIKELK